MSKRNLENDIKSAFKKFDSGLNNFKKLLESVRKYYKTTNDKPPLFPLVLYGLTITEPIAKIYYPISNNRGSHNKLRFIRTKYKAESFRNINSEIAMKHFWRDNLDNQRYQKFTPLVWKMFRNGLAHHSISKKVINVPNEQINSSFLSGANIRKFHTTDNIVWMPTDEDTEHSQFTIYQNHKNPDIPRPVFMFNPLIYYKDLSTGISKYKQKLQDKTQKEARARFRRTYPLMLAEERIEFDDCFGCKTLISKEIEEKKKALGI